MALRLSGSRTLNEITFQAFIDSFPLRNNAQQTTDVVNSHAADIEAIISGDPASGAEVVAARDQEGSLEDAVRKGDRFIGDGVERSVLNDFEVVENSTPDDKVKLKTGGALIDGIKVLKAVEQSIDPPNFTATAKERIDVVQIDSSGTGGTTTGFEVAVGSALAEIERIPDNTVDSAFLFLRSEVSSPFAPRPIKNSDDGTNSFIMKNEQRFIEERDITIPHKHYANWIRNGAFLRVDSGSVVLDWTITNGTLVRDATEKKFGDFSGKFTGDGTAGGSFIEQTLPSPESLQGRFITISAYLRLDAGTTAKTGRITIIQTGDTPEADFSKTVDLNSEMWQRVHITDYIDNSVTAVKIRIELDTTDPSTVAGFIDGVQFSIGRNLTEFEYPERISLDDDGDLNLGGVINFPSGSIINFLGGSQLNFLLSALLNLKSGSIFTAEPGSTMIIDGVFEGDGAFDTEVAVLAFLAQ